MNPSGTDIAVVAAIGCAYAYTGLARIARGGVIVVAARHAIHDGLLTAPTHAIVNPNCADIPVVAAIGCAHAYTGLARIVSSGTVSVSASRTIGYGRVHAALSRIGTTEGTLVAVFTVYGAANTLAAPIALVIYSC